MSRKCGLCVWWTFYHCGKDGGVRLATEDGCDGFEPIAVQFSFPEVKSVEWDAVDRLGHEEDK